jgi:hypothetical protein
VFSGEVVDFDTKGPFNATATLRVSEVWKGSEQETLEVHTRDPAFCGYRFEEGKITWSTPKGARLPCGSPGCQELRQDQAALEGG